MAPDPRDFKAPRLTSGQIREEADKYRGRFSPPDKIPVDIMGIVEFDLNLDILPVDNLKSNGDVEALLLSSSDGMVVDRTAYMDDRFLNRIRFSIAHELGHLILHADICRKIRPASVEEWYQLIDELDGPEYSVVESQAYEFAGRFLVPRGQLAVELKGKKQDVDKVLRAYPEMEDRQLIEYVANSICRKFGVSQQVISRRIQTEGFWPIPD